MFAQCELGPYLGAIELAFEGNLLLVAWYVIYQWLSDRLDASAKSSDDLAANPLLDEGVAIRQLDKRISFWGSAGRWLWWAGLSFSLVAVIFLYVLSWHVVPRQADAEIAGCGGLSWLMLMVAAYAGPVLMLVMAGASFIGNSRVSSLEVELRDAAEKKEQEQSVEVEQTQEFLKALLERKRSRRSRIE